MMQSYVLRDGRRWGLSKSAASGNGKGEGKGGGGGERGCEWMPPSVICFSD
jgi:hypothetical protein